MWGILSQSAPALDWLQAVSQGGTVVLLLAILYGGIKAWWVFGWMYREKAREAEQWKELALRGAKLAEKAVGEET